MWVAQNGSAQRATGSPWSCVSAMTPFWPRELSVAERERVLATAIAANYPPTPPRPVSMPRLERPALAIIIGKPVVWVHLLPLPLPSHQVHVSLCLHISGQAAA